MDWYRHRRVLIAGGLGFIGTNLSGALIKLDARVTVTTTRPFHQVGRVPDLLAVMTADIRDPEAMKALVQDVDIVFNLAGRSGAVSSMHDPWGDLDVNCRGLLVLLEAARLVNPQVKIVYPGSRLEYGVVTALPVDENHPTAPLSVHGVHKLAAEKYHVLYHRVYGLRTTVFRIANPYGAGQPSQRTDYGIVNRFIQLALADKPLPLYGDGRQLRDYIFVGDLVEAMLLAGASEAVAGKVFNVGSGQGTPMVEIATVIIQRAGAGRIEFVPWPALALAVETGDFVADIRQISQALGWKPRVGLEEGIELTIAAIRQGGSV
jgi:UDP-glucose 4-epimerase